MRRVLPAIVFLIVVLAAAAYGILTVWPMTAVNPDPNHAHADFAVWVDAPGSSEGSSVLEMIDFSMEKYMSGSSDAEKEGEHPHEHRHPYLHLHDENGRVIHRHKPGLTIGEFFVSIGAKMTKTTTDAGRTLEADCFAWEDLAGQHHSRCSGEWGRTLRMYVNGKEVAYDPGYVFADGDAILIAFAMNDVDVQRALGELTHDACLYSKTCPWRGTPPTEGCIADPTVPCKE